jgi:hypothetical protein
MKKAYAHNVLSTEKFCERCGKPLKKRIAEEKLEYKLCYACYKRGGKK